MAGPCRTLIKITAVNVCALRIAATSSGTILLTLAVDDEAELRNLAKIQLSDLTDRAGVAK